MALTSEDDIIDFVELVLGNPDSDMLPESVITAYIGILEDRYDLDTEGDYIAYYCVLNSIDYIKRYLLKNGTGVAGSSVKEKEGSLQYESSQTGDYGLIDGWEDIKLDFMSNVNQYLPNLDKYKNKVGMIHIGGVSRQEVLKVKRNNNLLKGGTDLNTYEPTPPTGATIFDI